MTARRRLALAAVAAAALAACERDKPAPKLQRVAPAGDIRPAEPTPPPDADQVVGETTAGAIPGEELVRFAPKTLGGVARSDLLDQAYAVAAAYALPGGGYVNLDIKNTFRRGGMDVEDQLAATCPRVEEVGGYAACVRRGRGRFAAHWDLKDRLTVDLAGPDEAQVRAMADELPLRGIAAVSAER